MNRDICNSLATSCLVIAMTALAPSSAARADCTAGAGQVAAPAVQSHGIECTEWTKVTDRLYEVTVKTPNIFDGGVMIPVRARILFPADYQAQPSKQYPVLFLLHGGAGTYKDWSTTEAETAAGEPDGGRIEALLSPLPYEVIVVMPEGGRSGWYSDWAGYTDGGFRPLWESFHVGQLVPWVDSNFRTLGTKESRSIAGLSMGGLGAAKYAAKYNELFGAVGTFSGGVDITDDTGGILNGGFIISNSMWVFGASIESYGLNPFNEGPPVTDYRITYPGSSPQEEELLRMHDIFGPSTSVNEKPEWPQQNPTMLADEFEGLRVAIYSGRSFSMFDGGEEDIARLNDNFHDALVDTDVPHRYCTGFGDHSFHYWRADLVHFVHFLYGDSTLPCPCPDADDPVNSDWNPLNDRACWVDWGVP